MKELIRAIQNKENTTLYYENKDTGWYCKEIWFDERFMKRIKTNKELILIKFYTVSEDL